MKYGKALMYTTLQGYNHRDLENVSHVMLTLDYPWDPALTSNELEIKYTLQNYNEFCDDLHISIAEINYGNYTTCSQQKMPHILQVLEMIEIWICHIFE